MTRLRNRDSDQPENLGYGQFLLNAERYAHLLRILAQHCTPFRVGEVMYRFENLKRGVHGAYRSQPRFTSRELWEGECRLGEFVLLEHWQISFNPSGHTSRYGFAQVTIQDVGQRATQWIEANGRSYRWNLSAMFKKQDGRNDERSAAFRDVLAAQRDLARLDADRVLSAPFGWSSDKEILDALVLLARISSLKFEAAERG